MIRFVFYFGLLVPTLPAQIPDADYFEFWPGIWVMEVDGKPDTSKTTFTVKRGVHPRFYEEEWKMVTDVDVVLARGIRVWERYMWLSEFGHYQLWESRKVGDHWYIYKKFNIKGDAYLSRQAWIPESNSRLMRISEKSYDDDQTWQLRFREYYRKLK